MINRSIKFISIIATTSALLLSACGGASTESRLRNGAIGAVAPDTPAQIFVKIDTENTASGCCSATPRHVAKLRWSAPVTDGGAPIIGYDIQVKWNAVEGAKSGGSGVFKDWTSCATLDKFNPGMFPACTTALTSSGNSAVIDSPLWQKSSDALSQHIVQALDYRVAAINSAGESGFSPATQTTCKYGGACEVGDLGPGGGVVYEVAKYAVSATGTITSDTSQVSPGFFASEVSGADWQFSTGHNWAAMGFAGETQCPGTSCYTPTPPKPCFDNTQKSINIQTCQSKESWHLPFVAPLTNGNEWKFLCNRYSELSGTWGRLLGNDALMYWSGSLPLQRAGFTFNLTVGNIISLVGGSGAGSVLLDMTQSAYENSMTSTYGTSSAMRFPCSPNTKLVKNDYDSNGRMYYPTSPSLGNNSGQLYTDNSVSSLISSKANLSIPIRHFAVTKPGLAPQTAPILTAVKGDGGVRLSWAAGAPSAPLTNALKTAQILPLTDYTIQYRPVGTATWNIFEHQPSVNISAIIGNGVLTKGSAYEFKVSVKNSMGSSPDSNVATATPGPFFQNALALSTTSGVFPAITLQTSGGSGTGAITYVTSDTANGCTISGNILNVTSVGTCSITATKAADTDFVSATSALTAVTIAKGPQAPLSVTSLSKPFDEPLTLTSQGGSGNGVVSFEVWDTDRPFCLLDGNVLTAKFSRPGGGYCRVRVKKATDTNYQEGISEYAQVLFTQGAQSALTLDQANNATFPTSSVSVLAHGGSGIGEVTFNARNGTAKDCRMLNTTVTANGYESKVSPSNFGVSAIGTGTCLVTATKAGDRDYRSVTSNEITVTFNKAEQAPLKMSSSGIGPRSGTSLATTGGSGNGEVTYTVASSTVNTLNAATNCAVSGSKITSDNFGSCWASATKAGDENYFPTTAPKMEFLLQRIDQPVLSLSISPKTGSSRTQIPMVTTVSGGAGTGTVSFSSTGGTARGCAVQSGKIYAESSGTCEVTATKAGDGSYVAATASTTFTFSTAPQATLSVSTLHGEGLVLSKGLTLRTSGGSGSGAVSYSLVQPGTARCVLSNGVLTAKALGTCEVTATKAGDDTYEPTTSTNATVSFDIRVGDAGLAGGTIVYIADTPQSWGRYIEVAPKTWKGSSDPNLSWADAILAASKYRGGGKSDWRLPNDAEMAILMKTPVGISNLESAGYMPATFTPYGTRLVRPVRVFG